MNNNSEINGNSSPGINGLDNFNDEQVTNTSEVSLVENDILKNRKIVIWIGAIIIIILIILVLVALFNSNKQDTADEVPEENVEVRVDETGENINDKENADSTISKIISENEEISTFGNMVQGTELGDLLDDPSKSFTIFIPSNSAFSNIQDITDELLKEENSDKLANVLRFHITEGEYTALSLSELNGLDMLNEQNTSISTREGVIYIDESQIVTINLRNGNKIVHILDSVLIPEGLEI